jgi:MOSC domain-containing protein YiiM
MTSTTPIGRVFQINVKPQTPGEHGLPKYSTLRALVTRAGLQGDFNRWRHEEAHDDAAMAILVMPLETIEELKREGWPIKPGSIGENFTTQGIPYHEFAPGKRYQIGKATIRITKACDPCSNLYALPNIGKDKDIVKAMYNRRGWYASVDREGWVTTGDSIMELNS